MISIVEPFNATTRSLLFGYDSFGRLSTTTDAIAGTTRTTSYDQDRVSQIVMTGGTGAVTLNELFAGRLPIQTSYSGGNVAGEILRYFDHQLRQIKRTVRLAGTNYPVVMPVGLDGLLTQASVRNTADSADLGRITYDTRDGLGLVTVAKVKRSDGTNALDESWGYNGFGEPKTYVTAFGTTKFFEVPGLPATARDKLGRITAIREVTAAIPSGPAEAVIDWAFTYDEAGRLKSATKTGVSAITYTYDANGNRTGATGGETITTTYDLAGAAQDRISSQTRGTATSYTYTNNGSLLTSTTGGVTTTYAYDLQSNLRTVTRPGLSVSYLIDGQNRRVGKVGGTRPAKWLYDDQLRIAAELDATTGAITHVYAYGERSHVPELVYQPGSGKVYRIVSDWRGSVRLVLEIPAAGTPIVRQRIDYVDAWGSGATEWTNVTGDANFKPVSLGFAGGLWDRDTGFVRFGARDYDPNTGRWTAKDPIRFDGGVNLYAYVENDPVNFVDPSGLEREWGGGTKGDYGGGGESGGGGSSNSDSPGSSPPPCDKPEDAKPNGDPDTLRRCNEAAGKQPIDWTEFCNTMSGRVVRAKCYSHAWSIPQEKLNWCYWQFGPG